MKIPRIQILLIVTAALALGGTGCGVKKKEITERQRMEAAHLASEAEFAVTVREWARAEGLFAKAAELTPDAGPYWISLGSTRVRQGKREGAKEAYRRALKAFEEEAQAHPKDPQPWIRRAYVLALLGRADDGRAVLQKAAKQFPNDISVRAFTEGGQFDELLAQPVFKQISL